MDLKEEAKQNLERLRANTYPGRGICVGLDDAGKRVYHAYWIMGRSENSRNRVFVVEGTTMRTAAADPARLKDPSLVIYNAMLELPKVYITTNGDQTDTIHSHMAAGKTIADALAARQYEPDPPNNTPRISAVTDMRGARPVTTLSILRKSPWSEAVERFYFEYGELGAGVGYTITTYMGDGNPLPSFAGEPYLLPLAGTPKQAAETLWGALNRENRVALAVKAIDIATGKSEIVVINGMKQV
jgi:IMP cyclohydrolase